MNVLIVPTQNEMQLPICLWSLCMAKWGLYWSLWLCSQHKKKKKIFPSRLSKEYTSRKTARYSQKCGGSLVGWNEKHPCNAVQITKSLLRRFGHIVRMTDECLPKKYSIVDLTWVGEIVVDIKTHKNTWKPIWRTAALILTNGRPLLLTDCLAQSGLYWYSINRANEKWGSCTKTCHT